MPTDEAVIMIRRMFEHVVNGRNLDALDQYFDPNYVAHSALLGDVRGVESFKRGFRAFLEPCPDFHASLEDVFAAANKVVARVTYHGTDRGGMFGRPATGRPFSMGALYVFVVADGRVQELWQEADRLGLLQQLGVIPTAG